MGINDKTIAPMEIKKINRSKIFTLFRLSENLTRQDVVQHLNLCLPTVTQNMNKLIDEDLLIEAGSVGNTGGRKAKSYSLNKCAKVAIGLDITKRYISVVMVNLRGEIIHHIRIRHDFNRNESYYRKLGEIVDSLVTTSGVQKEQVLGVGLGIPGLISSDGQVVIIGPILGITGVNCKEFSQFISYPTSFFNDANAASFAETWMAQIDKNSFYIMLSNNIGGSVLINGEVYQGDNIRSGEAGHMTIIPDGRQCYCGKKGCVDPYCSATVLSENTGGDLHQFFELLENRDPKIVKIWDEYVTYLSITLNNIRSLYDCDIIIGGYVGEYIDRYIDEVRSRTLRRCTFDNTADFIKVCRYKVESIAAGAGLPFIQSFLQNV